MGWTSLLDPSYLSEGGTSAFPPSDLQHRSQELEEAQEVLMLLYDVRRGQWDVPDSLTPKEIQDDATSHQTRRRWWQDSSSHRTPHLAQCVHCQQDGKKQERISPLNGDSVSKGWRPSPYHGIQGEETQGSSLLSQHLPGVFLKHPQRS